MFFCRSSFTALIVVGACFMYSATATAATPAVFTKNVGQWPDNILFRAEGNGDVAWLTKDGAYIQIMRPVKGETAETNFPDSDRRFRHDSTERTMIKVGFVGASSNAQVIGIGELEYKCNYFLGNDPSHWASDVPSFSVVEIRGIYPGVTVRLSGEDGSVRQQVIASPGADLSQVSYIYGTAEGTTVRASGPVTLTTPIGQVSVNGLVPLPVTDAGRSSGFGSAASPEGTSALGYSTYIGSTGSECGNAVAVDAAGNAYITGYTASATFPTVNPYDGTQNGGDDIFISKVSAGGNSLTYSTFVGGSGTDFSYSLALDGSGRVFVCGYTASTNFPTVSAYDATNNGGNDAFVLKLSAAGNSLIYSTYIGGSLEDRASAVMVDISGAAYVTGLTGSSNFPYWSGYDITHNGDWDAFVLKLGPVGNSLSYSTFLGGTLAEFGNTIAIDAAGYAYVAGTTASSNFPVLNAYDASYNGSNDAFVAKLSPVGSALVYSTYLGGSAEDNIYSITLSGSNAVVAGRSFSSNFPTVNAYDPTLAMYSDAIVAKLSSGGNTLVFSTYLGGNWYDEAYGVAIDPAGNICLAGLTGSSNFPVMDAYDPNLSGGSDAFVTKLSSVGNSLVNSTFFGGSNIDDCFALALDGAGSAYFTGRTLSSDYPTANPYDATYSASYDVFVTKLTYGNCCVGLTGNVDCDPNNGVDISDLSALIDYLYITFSPLCCTAEANTDGQPGVDIADLSALIDYLYISFTPPAACQ